MLYVFWLCVLSVFSLYALFSFDLCAFVWFFLAAFSLAKPGAVPFWLSPGFSNRLPWRYGGGVQRSHVSLGLTVIPESQAFLGTFAEDFTGFHIILSRFLQQIRWCVTFLGPVAWEGSGSCHAMVAASRRTLGSSLAEGWNFRCDCGLKMTQEKWTCQFFCGFRIQIEIMQGRYHGRPCRWRIPKLEAKVLVDDGQGSALVIELFCWQRNFMDSSHHGFQRRNGSGIAGFHSACFGSGCMYFATLGHTSSKLLFQLWKIYWRCTARNKFNNHSHFTSMDWRFHLDWCWIAASIWFRFAGV